MAADVHELDLDDLAPDGVWDGFRNVSSLRCNVAWVLHSTH